MFARVSDIWKRYLGDMGLCIHSCYVSIDNDNTIKYKIVIYLYRFIALLTPLMTTKL